MYDFLRTTSGIMIVVAIIAFIVLMVDTVAAQQRTKKAAKQGATIIKKRPIVQIISILVTVAMIAGAIVTDKAAIKAKDKEINSKPSFANSTTVAQPTVPSKYEEMQAEIVLYLDKHNDISKMYDSVKVGMNNGKVEFNITLQAYETYTFAAVTNAATDIVRTLVKDNGIDEYRLWVHSPSEANHTISWISFNLTAGLLNDKGYDGEFDEMVKLDFMLERYGYKDYEGSLSDFLNSQNIHSDNA